MRLPQYGEALVPGAAPRDRDQALSVLRRAVELGVNQIDTAAFDFSPLRSANELINRALAPYPDDLVIVTKVGPGPDPSGRWLPHTSTASAPPRSRRSSCAPAASRTSRSCPSTRFRGHRTYGGRDHWRWRRRRRAAIARAHGFSAALIRLAWTLHRGPHVLAIPGTGDPDHLTQNVAAGALRLSQDEVTILDSAA